MSGLQARGGRRPNSDFLIVSGQFNNTAAAVSTQRNLPGTSLEIAGGAALNLVPGFTFLARSLNINVVANDLDVTARLRLPISGISSGNWPQIVISNGTSGYVPGPTFSISVDETGGFSFLLDTSASAAGNITLGCWVVLQKVSE